MKLICSNKECSPLAPFTGVEMVRVQGVDRLYDLNGNVVETTMYCRVCQHHYCYEHDIPDKCPKCKDFGRWETARTWHMECPKCGRR